MCALRDIRELDLKRSSWDSSGRARERAREREKSAALEALDGEPVKRSTKSAAQKTQKNRHFLVVFLVLRLPPPSFWSSVLTNVSALYHPHMRAVWHILLLGAHAYWVPIDACYRIF